MMPSSAASSKHQVYRQLDDDLLNIFEEILGFRAAALVEAMQQGDPYAFAFAFVYRNKEPHPDFLWTGAKMILRYSRSRSPKMRVLTGSNVRMYLLLSKAFQNYPWTMVAKDSDHESRRGAQVMSESTVDRSRRRLQRRRMQQDFDDSEGSLDDGDSEGVIIPDEA